MSSVFDIPSTLRHLSHGQIDVTGKLVAASNATLYATCTYEGSTITCIYKPIAGERPLWDFQDGSLANREYASFLISHWMESDLIPPTVLRDGPYGTGMVQAWVDIDESIDLMEYFQGDDPHLRELALLDVVLNNTDRKIGHLLPTSSGHLYACDHGVTFHEEDKLRTVLWQWAGQTLTPQEVEWLLRLKIVVENKGRMVLEGLITEIEYLALLARIEKTITEAHFPEPSQEWPAVPWPPF
jgi:uncharacterized repeat protein (TIGR03843 family)